MNGAQTKSLECLLPSSTVRFVDGGQADEVGVEHVLDEVLVRDVVVTIAEERNAGAGVPVALRGFALGAQLERAALAAYGHACGSGAFGKLLTCGNKGSRGTIFRLLVLSSSVVAVGLLHGRTHLVSGSEGRR